MGLAGRKVKQRIPNDPRNLSWADDANKFGAAYLQKLGWSSGTGLGTTGDGRTTHIKVHHKLDMLGIGAAHQKDPNGLAWKQNRDFENLLSRLNAAEGEATEDESGTKVDGFARAMEVEKVEMKEESKKRKRGAEDDGEEAKSESEDSPIEGTKEERRKRKKEEKARKKEEKKRRKAEKKAKGADGKAEDEESAESASEMSAVPPKLQPVVGRPIRAHRARFMASKNIASKSSSAIDEILGISRSSSTTPYPSAANTSVLANPSSVSPEDALKMQELTTSSKSVMDYFKEKLLAKSNAASSSSSSAPSPLASTSTSTPRDEGYDDYDDRPRGLGAGLGFARASTGGIGASRLRSEVTFEVEEREEPARAGLGSAFASRMSAIFSAAKEAAAPGETVNESVEVEVVEERVVEEEGRKAKKSKKSKDGKKDKGKKREEPQEVSGGNDEEAEMESGKKTKKRKGRADDVTEGVVEKKDRKKSKHKPSEDESATPSPDADAAPKPAKEKKNKKGKTKEVEAEVDEAAGKDEGEKKKKKSKKAKSSDS